MSASLESELWTTVKIGNQERLLELINEGANVNETYTGGLEISLLFHAIFHTMRNEKDGTIVEILLKHGANVNYKLKHVYTSCLAFVVHKKNIMLIKLLLKYGAQDNTLNDDGYTMFDIYLSCCVVDEIDVMNDEITHLLLSHGAKYNKQYHFE